MWNCHQSLAEVDICEVLSIFILTENWRIMKTIDLKKELLDRITEIEDPEILIALKTILDYNKNEVCINLTGEQEEELERASEDVKNGNFITHEEMENKVESWLKGK